MDAARVRLLLLDGIDAALHFRRLSADQRAVLTATRREVAADDELCGRIASAVNRHFNEEKEKMAYKLIALPESLDDAPKVLLHYYTGVVTDWMEVWHAGSHLETFALGQLHSHQATAAANGEVMSDEKFKSCLEYLAGGEGAKHGYGAIDWKSVLAAVAQLLLRLLLEAQSSAGPDVVGCDVD